MLGGGARSRVFTTPSATRLCLLLELARDEGALPSGVPTAVRPSYRWLIPTSHATVATSSVSPPWTPHMWGFSCRLVLCRMCDVPGL